MAIPSATIPYGYVYVYGKGTDVGVGGNYASNTIFKFATIYGVGVGMNSGLIGDSVCFLAVPELPALMYQNYPYSILKYDAVIATEEFL